MFQKWFIYWLAILPFVVLRGYFEGPKIVYFLTGIFIISVFWIIRLIKTQKTIGFEKKDHWYLIWLLALGISSYLGIHFEKSFFGGSYRHQGVIFFLALFILGKTVSFLNTSQKKKLMRFLGLGAIIQSLIIIFEMITGNGYFGRPLGTLGEPNALAGYFSIGSYFVLGSFRPKLLLPPFISVLLTQSRIGIVSFIFGLKDFAGKKAVKSKKAVLISFLLAALVIVALVFVSRQKSDVEDRTVIWKYAAVSIKEKPVWGYGAESGEVVFDRLFLREKGVTLEGLMIDRSHNLFLDVTMWSGAMGLIPFIIWLYMSYVYLKEKEKKSVFLGFLVFSFFQPLSVVHWALLITLLNI